MSRQDDRDSDVSDAMRALWDRQEHDDAYLVELRRRNADSRTDYMNAQAKRYQAGQARRGRRP